VDLRVPVVTATTEPQRADQFDAAGVPPGTDAPTVDVVVPVYNEEAALAASVERLHRYLASQFPFTWRITIADNASTDSTAVIGVELAQRLRGVRFVHLDRKGRGLALRRAWTSSDAAVLAYTDVDLSTGLDALLPLVAPLVSGHSDVAIGSRLSAGANVARGPRREAISRSYNLILRVLFANRFRDAQCGFKAVRADVARTLIPAIEDDAWFFDTEMLLLAEHNGLRIHEVAVDWMDDLDSRVDVARTARDDLRGAARMAWRFASGRGRLDFGGDARRSFSDDGGRHLITFAIVGVVSTVASLVLFLLLRSALGAEAAVAVALAATAVGNGWAHQRFSFRHGRGDPHTRRHINASIAVTVTGIALSVAAVFGVHVAGGGLAGELAALTVAWGLTTVLRFKLLHGWAEQG
jgi:glycosyltransferase involved in cell wall biosynthesis/putative flippase GtrA